MSSTDPTWKMSGHKLSKSRNDRRASTFDIPERFKDGADCQDDVTAARGTNAQNMNQSVFSMIAAASSKTDFHARFDDSSESDEEAEPEASQPSEFGHDPLAALERPSRRRTKLHIPNLLKSLPILHSRSTSRPSPSIDGDSRIDSRSPRLEGKRAVSASSRYRQAPVMSRMLQAQAEHHATDKRDSSPATGEPPAEEGHTSHRIVTSGTESLAVRLMEIFQFDEAEDVLSEYPCWLLKSVLLQGFLYITAKHVCFYAYLPKQSNVVAKSGYLAKRGRQNPRYNRYWFTLKGDVLAYYANPSNLYFPAGNIDLRYGISAALVESKEKGKLSSQFSVTTHQRIYYFKADSGASAKEWVKTLQRVIFRSHNDGDSVKVSLPIENIIDLEDNPVLDFAETVKIRVIDNDETFAIDEYFFSFFSYGKEAMDLLRALVDNSPAQKISTKMFAPFSSGDGTSSPNDIVLQESPWDSRRGGVRGDGRGASTPLFHESVNTTLSPLSPTDSGRASPRASLDVARESFEMRRKSLDLTQAIRRASSDIGRRSSNSARRAMSQNHSGDRSPLPVRPEDSTDSFVYSLEREPESLVAVDSSEGTHVSASQILSRSDVFQRPTIRSSEAAESRAEGDTDGHNERRHSDDFRASSAADASIRIHTPGASHTQPTKGPTHTRHSVDSKRHPYYDHYTAVKEDDDEGRVPSPTLQELVKAGSYPLQRVAGFAGYLKNRSKRMSTLLATESMGYVEKVSGMWQGGRRHYHDSVATPTREPMEDEQEEADTLGHSDRFRAHFAFHPTERLQATYFGYLHRVLPLYGKIYISNRSFCFRSLLPGTRTKLVLPLKDIENVVKEKGFRFGYAGLVIVIRGHEELFFEFRLADFRDDCAVTLHQSLETVRFLQESGVLSQEERDSIDVAKSEHLKLQEARKHGHNEHDLALTTSANEALNLAATPLILFDDPRASIINFKPTESLRITCLTIGSRGDVQPYIALCKGLLAEGHRPKIASHAEFEPWVRSHGIEFATVDGDPAELMRICVENGMFTYSFIREASLKFRGWIDELLSSAWKACQESDILIESPSAMAGIHIAEALSIPYFRAFTMPWTRTRAYPHAFAVPEHKMGGAYNYFTYIMFDNVFWKAIAGQVNRWRQKELGLPRTNLDKMQPNKVPFLYNFSPHVVVPPIDYSDWIRVTGYWFLDEANSYQPPKELTDFIARARLDQKKLVYIGFGSIVISDPAALTRTIVESVLKADVRCILSKGWSDRLGKQYPTEAEVALPDAIFRIQSAPHDWLFQQIDAVAHHGGAGTTGASLRAGRPTIIKPFFGDQFFFGSRVEDLGVGVCVKKLNVSVFSRALWECTHSERMISKARVLGDSIRQEDGVGTAIQTIYRDLEYAKTLIKKNGPNLDDAHEESEESWTFIGDDSDPELVRKIAEWEPMIRMRPDRNDAPTPPMTRSNLFRKVRGVSPAGPGRTSSEGRRDSSQQRREVPLS